MYHGLAISTRRSYSSAQERFINFCYMSARLNSHGSPFPTDEWTLCLFVTFLTESLRHASIKVYLSAVRSLHIDHGFPDPLKNCLQLQCVLSWVKRLQGAKSYNQRLLITADILNLVLSSLDLSSYNDSMFWAACTLAYFGFLRSAEFTVPCLSSFNHTTHITVADIAVDSLTNPSCLQVTIKASKTDPFRQGCSIYIGKGNRPLCAVQAMVSYLSLRGDRPGPLFLLSNGQPLTRDLATQRLRSIIQAAGMRGNYSSHSFRIGAATMAAQAGIPDHLIQILGRWKSDCYKRYIQTPKEVIASTAKKLS